MSPTLPLLAPDRHRARTAQGNDLEKPQNKLVLTMASIPASMTGFLPKRSDARPQIIPVHAWLRENTADVMPAQSLTSPCGTPKLSIISGRYGKTDDKAIGSASRHIERMMSCCQGSEGGVRLGPMVSARSWILGPFPYTEV